MLKKYIDFYITIVINTLEFLTYLKYFNYYFPIKNKKNHHKAIFIYMFCMVTFSYFNLPYIIIIMVITDIIFNKYTYSNINIRKNIYHIFLFNIINYVVFFILIVLGIMFFDTKQTFSNDFYQYLKGIFISALMYIGFAFIFDKSRKLHLRQQIKPYRRLISLFLILIFAMLSLFTFMSANTGINTKIIQAIFAFSIIISIGVIILIIFIYQKLAALLEKTTMEQLKLQRYEMNETFYQDLSENIRQLRILKHDFKNHLIIINGLLEQENFDELDKYLHSIINYVDLAEVNYEENKSLQ